MIEGALYGSDNRGNVKLHFTVSPEHLDLFVRKTSEAAKQFEPKYGVNYQITFSEQKPSTDTIAVDPVNEPFRLSDGIISVSEYSRISEIVTRTEIDLENSRMEFLTAYMILEEITGIRFNLIR